MFAVAAVVFTAALHATSAAADPVRIITSGTIYQLVEDGETGGSFFGEGFEVHAFEVSRTGAQVCSPCTPGTSLNLSSTITLSTYAETSAIVDGRVYESIFVAGMLDIDAGSVIVPDVPVGGPYPFLTTPFAATGLLMGFADQSLTGVPLFSLLVAGGGTAGIGFFYYPSSTNIHTDGFGYGFEEAAATPEPGSLLLFASGAALIGRRWRKRNTMIAG